MAESDDSIEWADMVHHSPSVDSPDMDWAQLVSHPSRVGHVPDTGNDDQIVVYQIEEMKTQE